jgi:hypothetical protein
MTGKEVWKARQDDNSAQVSELIGRLNGNDGELRLQAESRLRQIAYFWEGDYDADFVVVLLEALAETGGTNVLLLVEHLAKQDTRSKGRRKVQAAAHASLQRLRERQQQDEQPQELLRASAAPQADPGLLVRPVHGSHEADPSTLVRPIE